MTRKIIAVAASVIAVAASVAFIMDSSAAEVYVSSLSPQKRNHLIRRALATSEIDLDAALKTRRLNDVPTIVDARDIASGEIHGLRFSSEAPVFTSACLNIQRCGTVVHKVSVHLDSVGVEAVLVGDTFCRGKSESGISIQVGCTGN